MGILYFFIALLVLAVMICIHELGHYTAGRLLGFKILDFSIGFGPAIFKIRKNDIDYALRAIPLGGACRFYGETDDPEDVPHLKDAVPFNSQKPWKRLIVIFAGPLMNFVLAYVLAVVMMLCFGNQELSTYANGDYAVTIVEVSENSPAKNGGLISGDIVLAVEGKDISEEPHSFEDKTKIISNCITNSDSGSITFTVLRGSEVKHITLEGLYNEQMQKNYAGITMGLGEYYVRSGFFAAFKDGFDFLVYIVKATFEAIADGFRSGFNENNLSGIVGTVAVTMKMASMGVYYVLLVMILISMSLGIMNLLPILPLDGGHLLFDFIELVVGKPVPRNIQAILSVIGFVLLIALMVYATVGDIKNISNGLFNW